MHEEPTNLYRVVAQTLQWVHGLTSMQYDITYIGIAKVEHEGDVHHAFRITTNGIRLARIKHPLGLVTDEVRLEFTGRLDDNIPTTIEFNKKGLAEIEVDDMIPLFLSADNSKLCNVAVQTKFKLFDGGSESIARHFMFKNNMLFQIR